MPHNRLALVFDFDGVLADTERHIWKAWSQILAPHHINFSWPDYCRLGRGLTDESMLSRLLGPDPDPALFSSLRNQISVREAVVRRLCAEHPPIPNSTVSMLCSLQSHRVGLVTSSRRAEVEPILERAGIISCFHSVVCGEDTAAHKPHPEPYLLIRQKLAIDGGLAFEDSDAGIASSEAAGFAPVRIGDPNDLASVVAAKLRELIPR